MVEISVDNGQFLSDRSVTLSCTINLPVTATSNVAVVTSWLGPNGQLRNSSSVRISNTYEITEGMYQSNVTISNFVTSVNNDDYVCNSTVAPTSPYVIGTSAIGRRSVSISG